MDFQSAMRRMLDGHYVFNEKLFGKNARIFYEGDQWWREDDLGPPYEFKFDHRAILSTGWEIELSGDLGDKIHKNRERGHQGQE